MTIDQYLGPLRPVVAQLATRLADLLLSAGITPPPEPFLSSALVTTFIVLFLSILISALTSLVQSVFASRRDRRDAVVIVGICGEGDASSVGKTTLFKALTNNRQPTHGTTSSMTLNKGILQSDSMSSLSDIPVIDFPGHPRLRSKLPACLRSAKAILFVVDARRFTTQARRDALLLFDILTHPAVARYETPLAIVVNKRDLLPPERLPTDTVRARLEAELDRVRAASADSLRSATVGNQTEGVGGTGLGAGGDDGDGDNEEDSQRVPLGYDNEAFTFDHAPGRVEFVDTSAKLCQVGQVSTFLLQCYE